MYRVVLLLTLTLATLTLTCSDSLNGPTPVGVRGDINANGKQYEPADFVMLTNYFLRGESAFANHQEFSIRASDVNADSVSLTIADLDFLLNVVDSVLRPIPDGYQPGNLGSPHNRKRPVPPSVQLVDYNGYDLHFQAENDSVLEIGAVWIKVSGNVRPELLTRSMDLEYAFDGTYTFIVICPELSIWHSDAPRWFPSNEPFVNIFGDIIDVQVSTGDGRVIPYQGLIP